MEKIWKKTRVQLKGLKILCIAFELKKYRVFTVLLHLPYRRFFILFVGIFITFLNFMRFIFHLTIYCRRLLRSHKYTQAAYMRVNPLNEYFNAVNWLILWDTCSSKTKQAPAFWHPLSRIFQCHSAIRLYFHKQYSRRPLGNNVPVRYFNRHCQQRSLH
jgi:hypothetical protein